LGNKRTAEAGRQHEDTLIRSADFMLGL